MIARTLKQRNMRRRSPGGFTLIELLLVMVIIAIMAGVVVFNTAGQSQKAKKAAAIDQISNLNTALHAFEVQNGRYPSNDEGLNALVNNPGNLPDWTKQMDKMPADPWGKPYVYRTKEEDGGTTGYDLYSTGPSGQDGNADNVRP